MAKPDETGLTTVTLREAAVAVEGTSVAAPPTSRDTPRTGTLSSATPPIGLLVPPVPSRVSTSRVGFDPSKAAPGNQPAKSTMTWDGASE